MPKGFVLNEELSRNFAASGERFVDHVYTGRTDKYTLSRFYRRHMPVNQWALVTDMFSQGQISLDFEKQGERCRILIDEGGSLSPARVQARVWPHRPLRTASR